MPQTCGFETSPLLFSSWQHESVGLPQIWQTLSGLWVVNIELKPITTRVPWSVLQRPLLFEKDVTPLLQIQLVTLQVVSREKLYAHHAVFVDTVWAFHARQVRRGYVTPIENFLGNIIQESHWCSIQAVPSLPWVCLQVAVSHLLGACQHVFCPRLNVVTEAFNSHAHTHYVFCEIVVLYTTFFGEIK